MDRRPWDVVAIAGYYAAFSLVLLGMIAWQMISHQIHAYWTEKILVLPFAFLLALLPGVIALGLWVLDNAARILAMLFAVAHAFSTIAWLSQPHVPSRTFSVFRIAVDIAIVVCLNRPAVRKAFHWQPVSFSLRNRNAQG